MDKGQTWQDIGQATGDPGQNGTDGKNGSDGIGVIPGGTTGQALVKNLMQIMIQNEKLFLKAEKFLILMQK